MLRIGEFSKLSRVSVRMLRHYSLLLSDCRQAILFERTKGI